MSDNQMIKQLPDHVDIDISYYPPGIGPGGFSPVVMREHAAAYNRLEFGAHEVQSKTWVILWLLDHVDWDKVTNPQMHKLEQVLGSSNLSQNTAQEGTG
jgi:hypothetical protein